MPKAEEKEKKDIKSLISKYKAQATVVIKKSKTV